MISNFALSLSFDGLRLMHRTAGGWHLVGEVALDDPDVTGALARLREAAATLEPDGIATKLLIPNDQIKYLALDTTRADDEQVCEALHGATPYSVDELSYDFAKGGGRTYVAAVARETLEEARQFAIEHNFNPISFAAVPEPFTFVGEAFFGATEGNTAERDAEPVVIIGEADVAMPAPPADTPEADSADDTTPDAEPEFIPDPIPEPEPEADPVVDDIPEVSEDTAEPEAETPKAEAAEPDTPTDDADDPEATEPDAAELDAPELDAEDDEPDPAPDPEVAPAPMFASRLRADRNEGRPAEPASEAKTRAEPTFSREKPAALAVPTDASDTAVPPLAAPSRDADATPASPITTDAPDADGAVPITGEAPTALSPDAAVAAASLTVEPEVDTPATNDTPDSETRSAASTAMGAASAVGGAVGGMFASRRMARAEAKAKAKEDEKLAQPVRKSVFGARNQPKPKPVVGGKPRFLGLILTAILLLFLLAFAAFAALSEDGIAAWFGFGGDDDTQIAATDPVSVPEVAATEPDVTPVANAPDALATPTAPTGGQVLSPEEATRIYAATGVWQRAPRIPLTPRTTSIEGLTLGSAITSVTRVPASPLASSSSISGDALIATPIDPPPPDATFDFGTDGLIVATPDGNVTPDGILVISGAPPLNPPTRPGTIAPEITPQDQIAAVIPEAAAPVENAPEGVIVIAGRPVIEPPIRTGTQAPAPAPEAEVLATGQAPLVASDGLLVLAGSPPILPPIRPGTVAPSAAPVIETPAIEAPVEPAPVIQTPTAPVEEGLNVIAGAPPVLPPARPGTIAPQNDAALDTLTSDVTAALSTGTAQTPTADTPRPVLRPAAVIQAAAVAANTPVLGTLTPTQAAAFRPRTRPAGLAPTPVPTTEPEPAPTATPEQQGLQIAPEIAAAVQAAANRPNPIVNPTALAVARSARPDPRPRNMERIVARANQAQERAATQVAAVAPRTVPPSGPTGNAVARNATLDNAINLRDVNLIGIYGGNSDRRALVRLGNGRYVRVTVGDRLDGGRVTAISASALSYTKRGRALTLRVAG